jgi:hypothetical protein
MLSISELRFLQIVLGVSSPKRFDAVAVRRTMTAQINEIAGILEFGRRLSVRWEAEVFFILGWVSSRHFGGPDNCYYGLTADSTGIL